MMLKFDPDNYPPTKPEHIELAEAGIEQIRECASELRYDSSPDTDKLHDEDEVFRYSAKLRAYATAIGIQAVASNPYQPRHNTIGYTIDDVRPTLILLGGVLETIQTELADDELYAKFENSLSLAMSSQVYRASRLAET